MNTDKSINAAVPQDFQKDGVSLLSLVFDADTDGWYLCGHNAVDAPALFEIWNMSEDDAKAMAESDWGIVPDAWSSTGGSEAGAPTLDANGTALSNGDTVTLIKDLPVKGAGVTLKRGTLIKNISLTSNPEEIDCRTKEVKGLVLKSCFVKKG